MVINEGVSFGLELPVWFVYLGLMVVGYLLLREKRGRVGLGLILVGGVMNLVSRARYGGVVDNWQVFGLLYNNLADYLIVGGVLLYGYQSYLRGRRNSGNREALRYGE